MLFFFGLLKLKAREVGMRPMVRAAGCVFLCVSIRCGRAGAVLLQVEQREGRLLCGGVGRTLL